MFDNTCKRYVCHKILEDFGSDGDHYLDYLKQVATHKQATRQLQQATVLKMPRERKAGKLQQFGPKY